MVQSPIENRKGYLRWQYLHAEARYLPKAIDKENFAFSGTTLNSISAQRPCWKRCVEDTDWAPGEALEQNTADKGELRIASMALLRARGVEMRVVRRPD